VTEAPSVRSKERRIISLSMVKNEQDIIEPFIRHNARFVDCMIVLDNGSVDETRRIAMDCARELGTVVVADCEEFGYEQAERVTRMLHYCQSAFFADFVVFLDADEFLCAENRTALLAQLEAIPPGGIGLMPWQTFVLTPGETGAMAQDPPRSMRRRRAEETPLYRKAVLRLDGACRADLLVESGAHNVVTIGGGALATVPLDDLPLLHFPIRSRRQLVAKGIVGWMAYLARDPAAREQDDGYQKRDVFDRVVSTAAGAAELDVSEISMRYAQNRPNIDWNVDTVYSEPPSNYIRRFSNGASAEPLVLIARSWERSILPQRKVLESDNLSAWDHISADVGPFRFIAERDRPTEVLGIGCGAGAYLALFKRLGAASVLGIDVLRFPAELTV
jgi:hypothetical protein